ncbi:hypothetical protein L6452_37040 [Arctium lappa]|uniref:Uncharacterized protein n=1 Tax=Arctium lappa TaxID=4217 RepID=A0ACB8Y1Z3_ARCLA|nr:hypothetical protein L6452_37040 [Arctium lappa]
MGPAKPLLKTSSSFSDRIWKSVVKMSKNIAVGFSNVRVMVDRWSSVMVLVTLQLTRYGGGHGGEIAVVAYMFVESGQINGNELEYWGWVIEIASKLLSLTCYSFSNV